MKISKTMYGGAIFRQGGTGATAFDPDTSQTRTFTCPVAEEAPAGRPDAVSRSPVMAHHRRRPRCPGVSRSRLVPEFNEINVALRSKLHDVLM